MSDSVDARMVEAAARAQELGDDREQRFGTDRPAVSAGPGGAPAQGSTPASDELAAAAPLIATAYLWPAGADATAGDIADRSRTIAREVVAALQPFRDAEQAEARQDERNRIAEDIQAIRIPVSRYLRGTQKQAAEIRDEALANAIAECRTYEQAGVRRDA